MLGKLLKYEFKATGRRFLPLYAAILVVSLLLNFGINNIFPDIIMIFAGVILFGLMVSLVVIALMTIVNRFKNNLLQDEGYLMFTLPVSTEKLIFSKLITAVVWVIVSFFVGIISFIFIVANREFFVEIKELIKYLPQIKDKIKPEYYLWFIQGIICVFLQLMFFILLIYTSLSMSQMAVFIKHRGIVSIVAFILLMSIINILVAKIFDGIFDLNTNITEILTAVLNAAIVTNTLLCVGLFLSTNHLLKKHLNIE